jgi:hypothetical protein
MSSVNPELEELYAALRNAKAARDAAQAEGDDARAAEATAKAGKLAAYIQSLDLSEEPEEEAPAAPLTPAQRLEQLQPTAPPAPVRDEGLIEKTLKYPMAAAGTAVGMAQGLGAGLVGNVYGAAQRIGGASMPEAEAAAQGLAGKLARQPSTPEEAGLTEAAGKALGALPPELGGVESYAGLIRPAAEQAAGMTGKALAPIAKPVSEFAQYRVVAPVTRAITRPSPEALVLAEKAREFGIDLPPHLFSNNILVKMAGEAMEHIPGMGASKEVRAEQFAKALIKQIGGDPEAKRLTSNVYAQAMNKSGKTIGDIAARTKFPIDNDFYRGLVKVSDELSTATPENQGVVLGYYEQLMDKVGRDRMIPGKAVRELNTALGERIRAEGSSDLGRHLGNFQNVVMDQLLRQMPKADRRVFTDARTKYAKGMTLEPLVAKAAGAEGLVSPSLLMQQVAKGGGKRRVARGTAGEMGNLAAIGQRFLKEPASSGTAERAFVYDILKGTAAGLGALGAGAAGTAAAGAGVVPGLAATAALAKAYNALGPKATRAMLGPKIPKTVMGGLPPINVVGGVNRGGLSIVHPPVRPGVLRSNLPLAAPLAGRAFPALPRSSEAARMMQAEGED